LEALSGKASPSDVKSRPKTATRSPGESRRRPADAIGVPGENSAPPVDAIGVPPSQNPGGATGVWRGDSPRPADVLGVPLGVSLGKSKVTPLDAAVEDYLTSYRLLAKYADYIAVNVSSPNTPGLRSLQDKSSISDLLRALRGDVPVLVKIAPDLSEPAIAELLEVCMAEGAAGVIATNTTLGRDGLAAADQPRATEAGGLSGHPLTEKARKIVHFVHAETDGRLPIIGVGGVMCADDASRLFDAGASLIQLYSGFIYHGPALVRAAARAAPPDLR
jgi:dihydroorotate dehydrogenase